MQIEYITRLVPVSVTAQCCMHAHILKPHTKLNVTFTQMLFQTGKRGNTVHITDARIESNQAGLFILLRSVEFILV